jgi:hypothetical protein
MRDIVKENKMKRTAKGQSKNSRPAGIVDLGEGNSKMRVRSSSSQRSAVRSSISETAGGKGEDYSILTLKYEINERGVGKILLPPSLSTLLQSDRVSISPSAGGLFIRSI